MNRDLVVLVVILFSITISSCTGLTSRTCGGDYDFVRPNDTYGGEEIDIGERTGNCIVEKIKSYYDDNGYYPKTLVEITPKYLDSIPVTSTEQEYRYVYLSQEMQERNQPFILCFVVASEINVSCCYFAGGYEPLKDYWECGPTATH